MSKSATYSVRLSLQELAGLLDYCHKKEFHPTGAAHAIRAVLRSLLQGADSPFQLAEDGDCIRFLEANGFPYAKPKAALAPLRVVAPDVPLAPLSFEDEETQRAADEASDDALSVFVPKPREEPSDDADS